MPLMPKVWVVRADSGKLMSEFDSGGFASIGFDMDDLTDAKTLEAVRKAYDRVHPGQFPPAAGNVSGQIHAFMNEIAAGDFIVTPDRDPSVIRYGEVADSQAYFEEPSKEHRHGNRRRVAWHKDCILRARLPDGERKSLRNRRTVFLLSEDRDAFLELPAIGQPCNASFAGDPTQVRILESIHQKNPGFFELLIAELLKAMGCTDLSVSGGPGDQGIDVSAELQIPFADRVVMHVQAKRYGPGRDVDMRVVNKLKHSLPEGGRGLVITTSDFKTRVRQRAAEEAPNVFLINGPELAQEMLEHWDDLPQYFRDQLEPVPTDPR